MDIRTRVKVAALGAIGCVCLGYGFGAQVVVGGDAALKTAALHLIPRAVLQPKTRTLKTEGCGTRCQETGYHGDSKAPTPRLAEWRDTVGDGTPDFLRLDSEADREAFRGWFVSIAEFEALRPSADVPPEIGDCAALLRYAYRNALRVHNWAWTAETGIEPELFPGVITKYHYPPRLLGPSLFRTRPGPASPDDQRSNAFAEFADAKTLAAFNTFFVSRDVRAARPGDLLFYRQPEQREPFHSMIYVGESRWLPGPAGDWSSAVIVYHNGEAGAAGQGMRRVRLAQLLNDPSPRWKPVPGNGNFLGVYRWNILRGDD